MLFYVTSIIDHKRLSYLAFGNPALESLCKDAQSSLLADGKPCRRELKFVADSQVSAGSAP